MMFSYTQVSQYLRCPRSYRFRYLDGWREKDSRATMCLAAVRKAVALLRTRGRGAGVVQGVGNVPRSSAPVTRTEMIGSGCFGKGSGSWYETTESGFANPNATCRRKLSARSQTATSLWLTSMPSDTWTAPDACSNGKPRVPVDRPARRSDFSDLQLVCYSWITGIARCRHNLWRS